MVVTPRGIQIIRLESQLKARYTHGIMNLGVFTH